MKTAKYFSATWCGPCKQLGPIMDEIQAEGMTVQKIDADSNPEICQSFGIKNIPTVVLQANDTEVGRKVGLNPKSIYIELYNQN